MIQVVVDIRTVCPLPIVLDAGGGWGDPVHIHRTIAMSEAAGVQCIEIEDQLLPRRVEHHVGIDHLVPIGLAADRIKEAVAARTNPDLVIVGRTNAIRVDGMDDALRRAEAMKKAGADMLFVWGRKPEEMRFIAELYAFRPQIDIQPPLENPAIRVRCPSNGWYDNDGIRAREGAAKSSNRLWSQKLNVTAYLKSVAGFVEFPIYVEEEGKRTVILHPNSAKKFANSADWEVATLDCSFPWSDVFLPQDVRRASSLFTEEVLTIKSSPKNDLFEGVVSLIVLNDDIELRESHSGGHEAPTYTAIRGTEEEGIVRLRRRWAREDVLSGSSRSGDCDNLCRIYCDGVPGCRGLDSRLGGRRLEPQHFPHRSKHSANRRDESRSVPPRYHIERNGASLSINVA